MAQYEVGIEITNSTTIVVEADSPEEVREEALMVARAGQATFDSMCAEYSLLDWKRDPDDHFADVHSL